MSLKVSMGAGEPVQEWMPDRRLCLTEDRERVVEETDADARSLWAVPGTPVPMAEAIRLGAVKASKAKAEAPAENEDQGEEAPAAKPARSRRS